jgi:hypothetical protein
MEFFSSKRAQVNNVTYVIIIFSILMTVAVALPYIQRDVLSGSGNTGHVNGSISQNNATGLISGPINSPIGFINIFGSILKMLFWYYGTLPLALEVFFIGLKIIFWILLYRLFIPTTGG